MKLTKTQLTPPLVAISVALCAALSSFGEEASDVSLFEGISSGSIKLSDLPAGSVVWTNEFGGAWTDAKNWLEGVLPNEDGTSFMYCMPPVKNQNYTINLGNVRREVTGIYYIQRKAAKYGGSAYYEKGTLAIGALGFYTERMPAGQKGDWGLRPIFKCPVEFAATQTWQFNDTCNWYPQIASDIISEADVVWKLDAGIAIDPLSFTGGNSDNFLGAVSLSGQITLGESKYWGRLGRQYVELRNDYGDGCTTSGYLSHLIGAGTSGLVTPVKLNLTTANPFEYQIHVASGNNTNASKEQQPQQFDVFVTNTWSGSFVSESLVLCGVHNDTGHIGTGGLQGRRLLGPRHGQLRERT